MISAGYKSVTSFLVAERNILLHPVERAEVLDRDPTPFEDACDDFLVREEPRTGHQTLHPSQSPTPENLLPEPLGVLLVPHIHDLDRNSEVCVGPTQEYSAARADKRAFGDEDGAGLSRFGGGVGREGDDEAEEMLEGAVGGVAGGVGARWWVK